MAADTDRVKFGLMALIRAAFPRIDYMALYPATVILQAADGSLELRPDSSKVGEHSGVPIRYGIPGVKATVAPGARVLLGFENGDPELPIATLWDTGTNLKLEINATLLVLNGGVQPIARVGDAVVGTAGPFPLSAVIGPPGNPTILG